MQHFYCNACSVVQIGLCLRAMLDAVNNPETLPGGGYYPLEVLTLSTTKGIEPKEKMVARHALGHAVCLEVVAVDHETRQVKVVEYPSLWIAPRNKSPREDWSR